MLGGGPLSWSGGASAPSSLGTGSRPDSWPQRLSDGDLALSYSDGGLRDSSRLAVAPVHTECLLVHFVSPTQPPCEGVGVVTHFTDVQTEAGAGHNMAGAADP